MVMCYQCGCEIIGTVYRRNKQTSRRQYYRKDFIPGGSSTDTRRVSLCASCAKTHDIGSLVGFLIVGGVVVFVISRISASHPAGRSLAESSSAAVEATDVSHMESFVAPQQAPIPVAQPHPIDLAPVAPAAVPQNVLPPAALIWSHITTIGTRWNYNASGNYLQIECSPGTVATVTVAPIFGNLDLNAMNYRVDRLASYIRNRWPLQGGTFTYNPRGVLTKEQ